MTPEMEQVSGKVTSISGTASGISLETARLFAREGVEVILTDIDADRGQETAARIGVRVCFVPLDVTQKRSWSAAFETALQLEVPLAGPLLERQDLGEFADCRPLDTGDAETASAL